MKRESHIETDKFDRAVSDALDHDPDCEAFCNFDDLGQRRFINGVLEAASEVEKKSVGETDTRRWKPRKRVIGAAAAVVLCTLGGLFWALKDASLSPARETYFGEVQKRDGNLFFGGQVAPIHAPIPVGKSIRTTHGTALLRLPTGIEWQMEKDAHAEIASLDSDEIQVSVHSGEIWFRVDPLRKGPAFSVDTTMGRIDVTGTIFVVDVEPSEVHVTLLQGEVWVTRRSGQRQLVEAGYTLRLGQGERHALAADEKKQMQARLTALKWVTEAPPALSAMRHETADGNLASSETESPPISPVEKTASKTSPRALLDEIQVERRRRNWGKVEILYKRLIQSAPGSEAAMVSRVSLGEIYLSKLGRNRDALNHFNRYLRSGHTALLPEAFYGKCKALRALGRPDPERRCLDKFIRRFPSALQVPEAGARLDVLKHQE